MIGLSVSNIDFSTLIDILNNYELVELRLDLMNLRDDQFDKVLEYNDKIILCYKNEDLYNLEKTHTYLEKGLNKNVRYIDIDFNQIDFYYELARKIKKSNSQLILSYHNYLEMPSDSEIDILIKKMDYYEPNIYKLCFYANSNDDNIRCLNLYKKYKNLIAFNLGNLGNITRLLALKLGAKFMYSAYSENTKTEESQFTYNQLTNLLGFLNDD